MCSEIFSVLVIIRNIVTIVQWAVPIILILVGSIDLVKAVMAGKEDDIKKNQNTLFKRVIAAVIVFLIPLIAVTVTGLVGSSEWKTCWDSAGDFTIGEAMSGDATAPATTAKAGK